jgi:hypothetical protein
VNSTQAPDAQTQAADSQEAAKRYSRRRRTSITLEKREGGAHEARAAT